jgi:hypothetical protein
MPAATARVWDITINQIYAGQDVVNHFAVEDTAVGAQSGAAVLAAASAEFIDQWAALQVNELTYVSATARQVVAPFGVAEGALSASGELTGEGMPGSVAVAVSIKTGVQGRSFRGRFYLSGVPLSPGTEADPNHLQSDFFTNYNDAADAFMTQLASADLDLGVLSRISGGAVRPVPFFTVANAITVGSRLDSQRRRLGRI